MSEGFEPWAEQWIAWARTPLHDAYWDYRDAFFSLVPAPSGRTLEIGCGEGRVTRDLAERGHRVTSIDASPTLLCAAADLDPGGEYVLADAEALPFGDASFELVVAHNVFMDVGDMAAAVREAGRVLKPGGRLCAAIAHPLSDAGRFESAADDARFVITGSYLDGAPVHEHMERDGLEMTFVGLAHPLEAYALAFEDAGLLIEAMREPRPSGASGGVEAKWGRIPMFLHLRAMKSG